MEIKLTEKQLQILAKIQSEKQVLQAEYAKVLSRETECLALVLESAGVDSAKLEGKVLEIKDGGVLTVSESELKKE